MGDKSPSPKFEPILSRLSWLTDGVLAGIVHGLLLLGVLAGRFALPEVLGGIVLNNLLAFVFGTALFWRFSRYDTKSTLLDLAAPFGFSSFGLWGFMGMLSAVNTGSLALLGTNTLLLEGLGELGDMGSDDGEGFVIILLLVAVAMFIASLYFLAKFLLSLGAMAVMMLVAGTLTLQSVQFLRRQLQLRKSTEPHSDRHTHLHHDLKALGYNLFLKGWVGAMLFFGFTVVMRSRVEAAHLASAQIYFYLGWSWFYDAVLQQILRAKLLEPYMQKGDERKKRKKGLAS